MLELPVFGTDFMILCTLPFLHISVIDFALKTLEESNWLAHIWTCRALTIQWVTQYEDGSTHSKFLYLFHISSRKNKLPQQSNTVLTQHWGVLFWLHRTESCSWRCVKSLKICLWALYNITVFLHHCHLSFTASWTDGTKWCGPII